MPTGVSETTCTKTLILYWQTHDLFKSWVVTFEISQTYLNILLQVILSNDF
jgi:hypothetical protein